jgi:hypothetical protein
MGENFEDCTEGGSKFADYTGIEFDYVNDTQYYMTGKSFTILSVAVSQVSTSKQENSKSNKGLKRRGEVTTLSKNTIVFSGTGL